MSNANNLPPVQHLPENRQLDGVANFLAFRDSIVSTVRGYGLEGYLDGSIPRPPANVAPAVLAAGPNPGQNVIPVSTANNSATPSEAEWELRNARVASRRGHSKIKCWAPGGGAEGQAPPNYKLPNKLGFKNNSNASSYATVTAPITSSSTQQAAPSVFATMFDLGTDLGEGSAVSEPEGVVPYQLDVLIADSNNTPSQTFLDSAASECCIRDKFLFVKFVEKRAKGRMAVDGAGGAFVIEGYGVVEIPDFEDVGVVHAVVCDEPTVGSSF
ncbi:hypothetical protein EV361DRAFT_870548 [Lentinula raphanica]|nr:hypothetical protein EV361DRAFT_870548 [Lentinula raphanica]